jgi:hypothetical protein
MMNTFQCSKMDRSASTTDRREQIPIGRDLPGIRDSKSDQPTGVVGGLPRMQSESKLECDDGNVA